MVPAEIPQSNILRRVVVGVVLVAAFQTLERVTVTVAWMRESTVRTPPRRVLWVNLFHADAVLCGLVLNVLVETVERPLVPPRRASLLTNVGQVLERYHRTTVLEGFSH